MNLYDNPSFKIAGDNTNPNSGYRIVSRSVLYTATFTTPTIIRLDIGASNPEMSIQIDVTQCSQPTNAAYDQIWQYQIQRGYYINTSGTVSERYANAYFQGGTNNGALSITTSTRTINFGAQVFSYQLLQAWWVKVECSRWDFLTVAYP